MQLFINIGEKEKMHYFRNGDNTLKPLLIIFFKNVNACEWAFSCIGRTMAEVKIKRATTVAQQSDNCHKFAHEEQFNTAIFNFSYLLPAHDIHIKHKYIYSHNHHNRYLLSSWHFLLSQTSTHSLWPLSLSLSLVLSLLFHIVTFIEFV